MRRDDLLTIHVDDVNGSAVAGLREVKTRSAANTPWRYSLMEGATAINKPGSACKARTSAGGLTF